MKKIARLMTALALMTYAFTSCEDIPAPFNTNGPQNDVIKVDPVGEGTKANPFNVSGIIDYTKELAYGASTAEVYVTGYVVNIREYQQQYNSLNYDIADDVEGKSEYFYVYGGKGLNKATFNSMADLPIGSKVTICGKVKNHNGVIEFDNQNYIVELDGKTSGGDTPTETIGTKDAPLSISEALTKINALEDGKESELNAYVKGKVVKVTTNQTNFEKYGNLNYLISEDGTESNTITVYSGDGLDGAKFTGIDALAAGDEVIVFGKLYKYVKDSKVTPEIAKGNYLVSLVKAGGGGSQGSGSNYGTATSPLTVAQAIALIDAESTISEAYVKGKISQIDSYNATYKSITYWISDDGGTTTQLQVYSGKGLNGADFSSKEDLTVGKTVVIKGALKKYNSTYEFDKTSSIISIDGEGGGGTQGSGSNYGTATSPLTVAQAIALIDAESNISEAYVKGKISKVDSYNATYKSITYWISDDGGTTTQLQVYSGKGLNGADFSSKDDLTVGKTVVIKGALKKYNSTYEFDKTSSIISIDGEGGGGTQGSGSNYGTATSPLTVAQAIALIDAESTVSEAYVKGKISKIDSYNATYKSITYWISDDGTTTTQLQVYSGKGLNGADFTAKEDLTVGKNVVIKGALKKYNSTYEFDKTSSIISID